MRRQEGGARQKAGVLTPRLRDDIRIYLQLSTADLAKVEPHVGHLGYWGVVTDQASGKRYALRGASCNLPRCNCDAVATEITKVSYKKAVV